ncbi:MAG TPA: tRNA pseudouridine(55) synthase TruB [Sandaracinaceae bacterium LLY-WYZ-13_1]|nr:tRNA pseudouridine(55) synthase TruB [Sandaracinaceae bacterium LLY-WYZ-13_1]
MVDKPHGPTSHDVVARVRKALGTRAVGHAGTLDPMATGVLVVAVGEGTKLVRWLTADDKTYRATVALGVETDTLDAQGAPAERAEVPALDAARVRGVAAGFVGAQRQRPPAFSAIKVDGQALHERARRGEAVEAPERDVTVRRLQILDVSLDGDAPRIELEVEASKGFYVRSLGRDLARALGTRGHLSALRRLRSGPFASSEAVRGETLDAAADGDEAARRALRAALLPLADACRGMPAVRLSERGVEDAGHGRPVRPQDAVGLDELAEGAEPVAMLGPGGALVAVGRRERGQLRVMRGVRAGAPR